MTLKVFDLQCEQGHVFEGWFHSADSYESQRERRLLSCPVCNSHDISKKLSAPRLNVSHIRDDARPPKADNRTQPVAVPGRADLAQLQAEFMRRMREMVKSAEDVGVRFAEEARRMHEGEAESRAIRGTASAEERQELLEEGIAVMPVPDFLDNDRLQ